MKYTSIFFTASASILEIHLKDRDLFWKCKENPLLRGVGVCEKHKVDAS